MDFRWDFIWVIFSNDTKYRDHIRKGKKQTGLTSWQRRNCVLQRVSVDGGGLARLRAND